MVCERDIRQVQDNQQCVNRYTETHKTIQMTIIRWKCVQMHTVSSTNRKNEKEKP